MTKNPVSVPDTTAIADAYKIMLENKVGKLPMTDGNGSVRVLVYGLTRDNECAFRLPRAFGKMAPTCGNVREQDGVYTYSGREFTCDILKPLEECRGK